RLRWRDAELLVHRHEIEVVPSFDDLPVAPARDRDAGELDGPPGRGKAERVSLMSAAHGAARHNFIAFGDHIFDDDLDVGESLFERVEERFEIVGAAQRLRREAMPDAVPSKHLINRFDPALVPDLCKPTTDERLVLC